MRVCMCVYFAKNTVPTLYPEISELKEQMGGASSWLEKESKKTGRGDGGAE